MAASKENLAENTMTITQAAQTPKATKATKVYQEKKKAIVVQAAAIPDKL